MNRLLALCLSVLCWSCFDGGGQLVVTGGAPPPVEALADAGFAPPNAAELPPETDAGPPPETDAGPPPAQDLPGTAGAALSKHTALGIPGTPSDGTPASLRTTLVKPEYVVAFNGTHRTADWAAWELNESWLGDTDRTDSFKQDPELPDTIPQATDEDYTNSGWQRGHLCDSADRTKTAEENADTFVFTNVVPQSGNSNNGPWRALEDDARALADSGKELYIYAGPLFDPSPNHIGAGVDVPSALWKVVVVLDHVGDGPGQVTPNTRVIAVRIPNTATLSSGQGWKAYRTTVDELEAETGLDLLSDVPKSIQAVIESKIDIQ